MNDQTRYQSEKRRTGRTLCRGGLRAALFALPLLLGTGCGDEMSKAWRSAAMPDLEQGVRYIVDGLISGFVELNTPDTSSSDSTSSTSTSSG